MIVLSDHSQSQVEREIDLFKAFDGFGLEPPAPSRVRRDGEPPEIAVCPSSRSAQVYVLDRERRAELDAADRAHRARARGRRPRHAPHRPPRRRGGDPRPPRRAALHARRHADRPARGALERRGRPRPAQPQRPRRPARLRHLPGRARPRVVGAALPDLRRGPALGPPGLRVHRLGRRPPRRRRLARVAARQRLARARCCGAAPARTTRRRAPSGRCATSCRWCASTSASPAS